jgi:high-affinity nickel-transport protein
MYETAVAHPVRRLTFNLVITAVSICSGLGIAAIAAATLLTEHTSIGGTVLTALANLDTSYAGFVLAGLFVLIGAAVLTLWRTHNTPLTNQIP